MAANKVVFPPDQVRGTQLRLADATAAAYSGVQGRADRNCRRAIR